MQTFHSALPPAFHNSTWIGDRTIDFLNKNQKSRFCIWASFPDPHHPFDAPDPWSRMHHPDEVDLPPERTLDLRAEHLAIVQHGLNDAIAADYGRAHAFAIPGFPYAGKTGGVDAPPRANAAPGAEPEEDGWFVAYAPASAPQILVAARVERRGTVAPAALVKAVLEAWRQAK